MPKSQQTKRRNVRCGVRSPDGPNDNDCKATTPPPPCASKAHISSTPFSEDVFVDMSATISPKSTLQDVRRHSPLGSSAPPKRHIPRPANSFMLFRKDYAAKHKGNKDKSIVMSQTAGKVWRGLPQDEKDYWTARAVEVKDEHARQYPDYRFQPIHRERISKAQNRRMSLVRCKEVSQKN